MSLAAASPACATLLVPATPKDGPNANWQVYVDDLSTLQAGAELPDHFQNENPPTRIEGVLADAESFCGEMDAGDRRAAPQLPADPSVEPWQDDVEESKRPRD